ncbi:hypothetical protein [Imtechella halotolerans]|uniref:hypothetical protein n=1 Tax=Imtechella halotolerans TaxID=1165090 RepID=UPI001EE68203|nr:hypothetical protein [Imtechella halotolerans]
MELAISRVTSLTLLLSLADIFRSCSIIGSTLVPENIPTIAPFLPFAFFVSDNRIEFSLGECRFINGKI